MRKIIAVLLALCLASGALPVLSEGAGGSILTMLQNKFKTDLSVQQDPELEEAPEETDGDLEEDQALVAVNLQAIKVMLDKYELKFSYQEDQDTFLLFYTLDSDMESAAVWLTAYDDGVWVRIDYEEEIPDDKLDQILILCSLFNEEMRLGCFYVDRENKSLGYRFFLYTDVLPPTQVSLAFSLALGISMMENRGEAVAAVLYEDMNAWDAFRLLD